MNEASLNESPNTIFCYSNKYMPLYITIAAILIILGIFVSPPTVSTGILLIAVQIMLNKTEMIRLYDKHSEIKLAPLRARKFIKNSDIKNVVEKKNKITLEYGKIGNTQSISIQLGVFSPEDQIKIKRHYNSLVE